MMPGLKVLNPQELAHRWVKDLGTRPNMSMKVERKLHDMRMDVELRECTARSNSCDLTVGMIDTKSIE